MKKIVSALALVFLASCGFQPVYGGGSGALNGASRITVDQIDGRTGHAVRKALLQELSAGLPGIENGANLSISIEEDIKRLAFRPDGAASRSGYVIEGRYVLDIGTDAIAGTVDTVVNYNVPSEPYADIAAQRDAADRAANQLARNVVRDLQIKLNTRK